MVLPKQRMHKLEFPEEKQNKHAARCFTNNRNKTDETNENFQDLIKHNHINTRTVACLNGDGSN